MRIVVCFSLLVLALASPAIAQDAPQPVWKGGLGLSYVATTGNSDTMTLGLDFALDRKPEPWGLEIRANWIQAEQNGTTTAERYGASFKGKRALSERWEVFGVAAGDRDTFSGYDLRTILGAGGTYKALRGPKHALSFDAGLSWTREELVEAPTNDYLGGLLGLNYAWQITATSKLTETAVWYPNFDVSSDWRAVSETAIQAAVSSRLALKLGYLVRYDHQPVAGFKTTDTTSTASVVWTF